MSLISLLALVLPLSTMIATEFKFHFAGIKSLLFAGQLVGGAAHQINWSQFFSLSLFPHLPGLDFLLGIATLIFLLKRRQLFLFIWFLSPLTMLLLGSHNAPWFLIGKYAAAIVAFAYLLSQIKPIVLVYLLTTLVCLYNFQTQKEIAVKGQQLLEPDNSALLSRQIAAIDYTYTFAKGEPFAIDSVTNPLYINAVWAWHYDWYGRKYGYLPTWLGGDQLSPYNTLGKATGKEKYLFLIIDQTPRIPSLFANSSAATMTEKGELLEEKEFAGIKVMSFLTTPIR